ncbi:MAG: aryl-sulfate sulfotransferase [Bryobacteraceae bacterium]
MALLGVLVTSSMLQASPTISALTPSLASPQLVGTTITWTATATDAASGRLVYRFYAKAPGAGATSLIVRDLHPSNSFQWTPSQSEGIYSITVVIENQATQKAATASVTYRVNPIATGANPVVSATAHPLVALYSAPACAVGSTMIVAFKPFGSTAPLKSTSQKACNGTGTMNFYVAGMRAQVQYVMFHKIITGATSVNGSPVFYTTAAIPPSVAANMPAITIVRPASSLTSAAEDTVLFDLISPGLVNTRFPIATDLSGGVLWYYQPVAPEYSRFTLRALPGGTMLIVLDDPSVTVPSTNFQASQIWREIDLAGNTVRETNVAAVAAQVAAAHPSWNICNWTTPQGCSAGQTALLDFHHDTIRVPNGQTLILMTAEKVYTDGTQGSSPSAPIDIVGDFVVALDANMQLKWTMNSFETMDVTRSAVMNETCTSNGPGCPPINFASVSNDWLHSNSISYTSDGNLLISQRHQDWVVKVNYGNGAGSAAQIWRLGLGGDFTMTGSGDSYPWFSHQHHAGFDVPGQPALSLFDNGNTRVTQNGTGNSRGYVINVDEVNHTVTPVLLADLGNYSAAVGTAQRLANNNYAFGSGFINVPVQSGQSIEVVGAPQPTGTLDYTIQSTGYVYRQYRLKGLYAGLTK